MTKINKIIMHGFKSFAKHTELMFGGGFNVVLGPNGAGKCIIGSTLVQLSDGSLIKITDLVEQKLKTNTIKKLDDGLMALGDSTSILCLDTNSLKTVKNNIQAYIKRKAPEKLLKIKTRSGREIIATEYHPLFTLNEGRIESINAEDLKEGTKVAVPRRINLEPPTKNLYELIDMITVNDQIFVPFNKHYVEIIKKLKRTYWEDLAKEIGIPKNVIKGLLDKQSINFAHLIKILKHAKIENNEIITLIPKIKSKTSSIKYTIPWENTPELSRLLGYLLAEGRFPPNSDQIWFTNGNDEIVQDYLTLMKKLFDITPTLNEYKPNTYDVIAYSAPIRKILILLGMSLGKTKNKKITNLFLKHSSNIEVAELLNGLYCGDGYISKTSIEIVTKSKELAIGIGVCLSRLGIRYNIKDIVKIATNSGFSGLYKNIVIYGIDNFKIFNNYIKLVHKEKQTKIERLLNVKSNPNIDLIEANALIKNITKELNIKIKPNKKKFPKLDAYCYNQCLPSRNGIKQLIKELFLPVKSNQSSLLLIKLQLLAESDIFWDEIIEIEKIKHNEEWVYDLCIEKNHNFIANNLFIHNSNVLDALCFVLGKGSAKAMRAEKSSNLIYNGGKSKKPAKHGEVSIYFDNSSKKFPTDAKEVKITRIVRQNGQSIYKINDKLRTRQQIIDLLNIAKINPDGYNIILQGDIVRFVEMPPIERRMLIEEISGISVYEEKKHKAELELEKVEKNLNDTEIILKERGTYLKELKKDKDQALKFKDMSDKIKMYSASLLKLKIDKKEAEKADLEDRYNKTKTALDKINEKISQLKKDSAKKKEQINAISKEIEEKGEKEQITLNKEVETLKIELTKHNSRIEHLKNEIARLTLRKEELKNTIKETNEKISQLNQEKANLQKEKESKEKEKENIFKKISEFKQKNELDSLTDIEKNIDDIDKKIEERQKEINALREEQHSLIRKKDILQIQISNIDETIKKVSIVEKEHKTEIEDLKNKRALFKKLTLDLNKNLEESSSLSTQIPNSRNKLSNAQEELAKLKAKEITIHETKIADIATKKILGQKNKIKGIYGTVAELADVPSKYALALEVAAGPRLKSIVVEDDKVATNCIKYLKENKLGIATFMPLNKIKPKETNANIKKLVKAKGSYGLALEIISYDKKFQNIFSYLFANTLIIENIDAARKIGIGKARMVTVDGDLLEPSGLMTGGFRKRKVYGFKEKELTKDIDEYSTIISNLKNIIATLEKRRDENEKKAEDLRKNKVNLEAAIIKTEKTLHLEPTDLELSKQKKDTLKEESSSIDKDIENITEKISALNKELTDLKIEKQNLKQKITELRDPALIAELSTFEEKNRQFNENIIQITAETKNINTQINTIYLPEIEKIQAILKQLDKEENDFNNEIEELNALIKNKNDLLKQKEDSAKLFYKKFRLLFEEKNKLDADITKNENLISKKLDESRDIEIRNNTLSIKKADLTAVLAGLKQEFQQYEGVKLDTTKNEEQLKNEISKFEKLKETIGSVNMRALEIYEQIEKEFNSLLQKKEKLSNEKEDVLKMMQEIESKKKDLFMQKFNVTTENFKNIFNKLSTKGEAYLQLENPENPFEAGLNIKVKISSKKLMDIRSLSGGEKTLTALAFIFAIQEHEPASFYILDEVDAALDKHNSEKFAKLIGQYAQKAQYILISHNDQVISEANTLYGVSMDEHNTSKVISLKI